MSFTAWTIDRSLLLIFFWPITKLAITDSGLVIKTLSVPARQEDISDWNLCFLNDFLLNLHKELIKREVDAPRCHRVDHVGLEAYVKTTQTISAIYLLRHGKKLGDQSAGVLVVLFAFEPT